jgi:fructoselysine-6-P-deglycase FrlB-like protein
MANKTYPEICNQYDSLGKTTDYVLSCSDEIRRFFDRQYGHIIFIGSGSSYSLCETAAMTANLNLPKHCAIAMPAGDLMLHMKTYAPLLQNALVFVLSRSGSTDEIVNVLERLKKSGYGAQVFAVVAKEGSRISGLSDLVLEIPWSFDESVCQTRSVTNLIGAAQLVLAVASGRNEIVKDIRCIAENGGEYLKGIEPEAEKIAALEWSNVCVLADGEANGVAEEGSLAFNEIAYIPSVCRHILDVRHGPIVLVSNATLVLMHVNGDGFSYQSALVKDLQDRGGKVVLYSAAALPRPVGGIQAGFVFGRELHPAVAALPMLAIAQLLSYYSAVGRGINPDEPLGLDPWIAL